MASNTPEAEEVSRVNKLLQIEDLVWSRQLEKAVSVWIFLDLDVSFYCGVQLVFPLVIPIPSTGFSRYFIKSMGCQHHFA